MSDEERTAIMITTAFQTAEKIMAERQLKPSDVAFEYAHRLIYKIWNVRDTPDQGRDPYRDAVLSYMSEVVDRELDGWGDGNPPRDSLTADDAVRDGHEAALKAAFGVRVQDPGLIGQVHAVVEITEATKALVRSLAAVSLGGFDSTACAYVVTGPNLVPGLPAHVPSQMQVVNAFVAPLRAKGFVVGVRTSVNPGEAAHG